MLCALQDSLPGPFELLTGIYPRLCSGSFNYRILPGKEAKLLHESYSITLPEILGLDPSKRTVKEIKIESGETTALNVRVQDGLP
jgi:hypothetical protein